MNPTHAKRKRGGPQEAPPVQFHCVSLHRHVTTRTRLHKRTPRNMSLDADWCSQKERAGDFSAEASCYPPQEAARRGLMLCAATRILRLSHPRTLGLSDSRTFGFSDSRTFRLSDPGTLDLSACRIFGFPDSGTLGFSVSKTFEQSNSGTLCPSNSRSLGL